ncbi:hypothetical protein T4B_15012 [Trichinella pseudospiralis]|uniref:Uncharacterized protein n=1 Tax=Trichinella pseudospiralis TaxID=6337 RepID=A0A0V1J732_TRIPS|nr:hypothetical protein T4B_15012 [Trichinella pseudospiralis]
MIQQHRLCVLVNVTIVFIFQINKRIVLMIIYGDISWENATAYFLRKMLDFYYHSCPFFCFFEPN